MSSVAEYEVDWELEATTGGTGEAFEIVPAGNHAGTIIGVIDMGTHRETVTNDDDSKEDKDFRKLAVVFELAKKQANGKPFFMVREFNRSFSSKSNFRKFVEGVIGHKFADGEKFAPPGLLGLPVMVQVTHSSGKDKQGKPRTYDNIATVAQFPEGLPAPTPTQALILYSVKSGERFEDREWLPRIYGHTIKSKIDGSVEVRGRQRDNANGYTSPPPAAPEDDQVPY